jgi:MerR family copper efflux transcriptional regulator
MPPAGDSILLEKPMNIGQASAASGINAKMIRYYESIELISPANRTDSGYRQYVEKDVETLRFIKRSRELGFSVERIKMLLSFWSNGDRKSADVKKLARQYIAELDNDIEKLQAIRDELKNLADCCHGDSQPTCPILEGLASRGADSDEPNSRQLKDSKFA